MFKDRSFWYTIVTLILTIAISFYTIKLAEKKRDPVYSFLNKPALLFDKATAGSNIKLYIKDSVIVEENIYISTIALWNKGREAIEVKDIRNDFIIQYQDDNSSILDYRIIEENKQGVSNFRIVPMGNSLKIEWDHFDPDQGIKLQLIHTGSSNDQIKITGSVLGADLEQVTIKQKWSLGGIILIFFSLAILWGVNLWIIIGYIKELKREWSSITYKNILFVVFVTIFLIAIGSLFTYSFTRSFIGIHLPF